MVTSFKLRPINKEESLATHPRVTTYCNQECSTCGRRLRIRVEYLGHELVCPHCQRHFRARAEAADALHPYRSSSVLERANRLLASLENPGEATDGDGGHGSDAAQAWQHAR